MTTAHALRSVKLSIQILPGAESVTGLLFESIIKRTTGMNKKIGWGENENLFFDTRSIRGYIADSAGYPDGFRATMLLKCSGEMFMIAAAYS